MGAHTYTYPEGPLEGDPAGPAEWAVPAAIARELGIARDTVRKYVYAEQPPTQKLSAQKRDKLMALRKSATVAN